MKTETFRVTEKHVLEYLEVEELPVELQDYIATYELREWTFGERERIIGLTTKQEVDEEGTIKSTIDSSKFRLAVMGNCIRMVSTLMSAPTKVFLEEMPVWMGESIWFKVNALNEKSMNKSEAKKFQLS